MAFARAMATHTGGHGGDPAVELVIRQRGPFVFWEDKERAHYNHHQDKKTQGAFHASL